MFFFFRQNINSHEVPYSRLLDSPSRLSKGKESGDPKISPTPSMRPDSVASSLLTPKSLRIPAPKTSSSDSKLTVDYFQGSEVSVRNIGVVFEYNLICFLF